ncbi:MAG TPA: diacylglycerol kinase family protein [Chloroflexota bacterium]|nr:diacylglycerol kinase family protein [Chloroflexota bacterium]
MRQPISPERAHRSRISAADQSESDRAHPGTVQPPSSAAAPDRPAPSPAAFIAAFGYAWQGIVYVVRTQRNARVHLAIAGLVLVLAALLRVTRIEWAILLLCILAVLATEMLNTVVEAIVDLITDHYHPLARIAKDVAAGTVLFTAIGAAIIGLVVLGPYLWHAIVH